LRCAWLPWYCAHGERQDRPHRVPRAGRAESRARPARRRLRGRGIAGALLDEIEQVIRGAYDLGALGTTEMARGFYEARGWQLWQGPSSALTPRGIEPTPDDDGGIYVLPVTVELDPTREITADWRDADVW